MRRVNVVLILVRDGLSQFAHNLKLKMNTRTAVAWLKWYHISKRTRYMYKHVGIEV